jgi:hypothetical protein
MRWLCKIIFTPSINHNHIFNHITLFNLIFLILWYKFSTYSKIKILQTPKCSSRVLQPFHFLKRPSSVQKISLSLSLSLSHFKIFQIHKNSIFLEKPILIFLEEKKSSISFVHHSQFTKIGKFLIFPSSSVSEERNGKNCSTKVSNSGSKISSRKIKKTSI